ncbi:hypothetical protein D9M72_191660 [compost metagenome]
MHGQQGVTGGQARVQAEFTEARPMGRRRAAEAEIAFRDGQPVEGEARGEFRRVALQGGLVEAALGAGCGVEGVVEVAGDAVDAEQPLAPGRFIEDLGQAACLCLVGLAAEAAMQGGAVGLVTIGGEARQAIGVQALAEVFEPKVIALFDADLVLAAPEPGVGFGAPGLQGAAAAQWQPELAAAQVADAEPVLRRGLRPVAGQLGWNLAHLALAEQTADVFAQAAVDDAQGDRRLVCAAGDAAHASTQRRSARAVARRASRRLASGAISRRTPR